MARSCVFCGSTPLTNEHVFPRWMAEGFPPEVLTEQAIMVSHTEKSERRHTGRMFTTTVKSVCTHCNSGWMSDLEGAAKPTLLPMVRGEITEISPAGQEVLATWTLKTALMCQLMQSKTVQNLPTSHYADLSRDRLPSQQMRVFTAYMPPPQYLNGESPIEYRSIPSEARFTTADGVQHRLWSTVVTLRIGWAVLQLISVGPLGYDYEIALSGFAPYVRQLWPIQETVSWPPLMLRSVGDLDQLSDPLKSPHIAI